MSIYDRYPLLDRFIQERRSDAVTDIIGPLEPRLRRLQDEAFRHIDAEGLGSHAEKQAAMICAALIIEPASMYYDIARLVMNYGEEMEYAIEPLMSARPGEPLPPIVAQARAAAGAVIMENMTLALLGNEDMGAKPEVLLAAAKQSFSQDETSFAAIEDSSLPTRFLAAKEKLFSRLEEKIAAENPAPKKPKGRSFDL